MKKRGTHIDVVLSFVIFISLLLFVYSIFESEFRTQSGKESVLDYLETELIGRFSMNLTVLTVQISETLNPGKDCFRVQNIVSDIQAQGIDEEELVIKDENGNILNYDVSGQALNIGTGTYFIGFLKLYNAEVLDSSFCPTCGFVGCDPITSYNFGLIKEKESIFAAKIEELADEYNSSYENLKNELGMLPGTEFGFIFEDSEGEVIAEAQKNLPDSSNIYVREIPILYVNDNGLIFQGFLIIKVW